MPWGWSHLSGSHLAWVQGQGFPKGQGCLKPAWEPILLCRKPGKRVLPLGIDECRVVGDKGDGNWTGRQAAGGFRGVRSNGNVCNDRHPAGRYPANLVHDGTDEVLEAFAAFGESKSTGGVKGGHLGGNGKYGEFPDMVRANAGGLGDTGTAARFFYCAKASRSERGEGNLHPTVKPLALMEWLVCLVAREGETVLDPFAGSGTTLLACERTGRKWVSIEREVEYIAIARRRLAEAQADAPLFSEGA